MGNRTAIVDERGKTEFAYDACNRLIRHTYPGGQEFVFWYDANSNRT
ncbi:MAG: RHS repeat domain-containing protein [Armatimonadota bacterium]